LFIQFTVDDITNSHLMGMELHGVSARLQGAWTFVADKTLLHYRGSRGSCPA